MSRYIYRYKLDPTGSSPSNFVRNETRTLQKRQHRALVPLYGAFFADTLRVRDKATNTLLKLGKDYIVGRLLAKPSAQFGKEVYSVIIIKDAGVSDTIELDYQVVGGEYENLLLPILEMLNALKKDSRPTQYTTIDNRPTSFTPVRHMHDIGDLTGFDPVVHEIERARMTMELSSALDYENYYQYTDRLLSNLATLAGRLIADALALHEKDMEAHSNYVLRARSDSAAIIVRAPKLVSPVGSATGVQRNVLLQAGPYYCMYRNPQKAARFQVSKMSDFSDTLIIDAAIQGTITSYQYSSNLAASTRYYWRVAYQADDLSWSPWSAPATFTTRAT